MKSKQEKPTIKFTLRLTPEIKSKIELKAKKKKMSMAEYIRIILN